MTEHDDHTPALRYDQRPPDHTPIHTEDLPATPTRDRNIVASAWIEAPAELLTLGSPTCPTNRKASTSAGSVIGCCGVPGRQPVATPATGPVAPMISTVQHTFRLYPDATGDGTGPSGQRHTKFRPWKEDLLGR